MSDSENPEQLPEDAVKESLLDEDAELTLDGITDDVVEALKRERDEYLDLARRVQADFENYKKRVSKQMADHSERAAEIIVEKLLGVLDTMDLATQHDATGPLEQVVGSLTDVLHKEGLERVDQTGVAFDPEVHDAVAHEDGDGEPEVIEVMRAGYKYKGKVLRPAMVKVKGA